MQVTDLLYFAIQNKASDLHISSGLPPLIRVNGDIRRINLPELSKDDAFKMANDIMTDNQRRLFQQELEVDFSIELPGVSRFRVNAFNTNRGAAMVLRPIPNKIMTLEQLKCPRIFEDICDTPRGMVLVTGPTGSGKSTTLAAMVDHINTNRHMHILTIEDPIEFVHQSKRSLINQRELFANTHSFDNALRSALREDPDVILVGELRDLETMRLALTAAETGHLVFATLHTTGAAKTIDRIVNVFPAGEQDMIRTMVSESLRAVISQVLVKTQDNTGRAAAHEIMVGTSAIRNLIRENKIAQMGSMIQTGQQHGMQTLDQSLSALVARNIISLESARAKAQNPQSL